MRIQFYHNAIGSISSSSGKTISPAPWHRLSVPWFPVQSGYDPVDQSQSVHEFVPVHNCHCITPETALVVHGTALVCDLLGESGWIAVCCGHHFWMYIFLVISSNYRLIESNVNRWWCLLIQAIQVWSYLLCKQKTSHPQLPHGIPVCHQLQLAHQYGLLSGNSGLWCCLKADGYLMTDLWVYLDEIQSHCHQHDFYSHGLLAWGAGDQHGLVYLEGYYPSLNWKHCWWCCVAWQQVKFDSRVWDRVQVKSRVQVKGLNSWLEFELKIWTRTRLVVTVVLCFTDYQTVHTWIWIWGPHWFQDKGSEWKGMLLVCQGGKRGKHSTTDIHRRGNPQRPSPGWHNIKVP